MLGNWTHSKSFGKISSWLKRTIWIYRWRLRWILLREKPRITMPPLGRINQAFRDLFEAVDLDYVEPPKPTARIIEKGAKHTHETSCLPLAATVGGLEQVLRDQGPIDIILMAGGCGPCRFGYYAQLQRKILDALGLKSNWVVIEPKGPGFLGLVQFVRNFREIAPHRGIPKIWINTVLAFKKAQIYDELEKQLLKDRAIELEKGAVEKAYSKAVQIIRPVRRKKDLPTKREEALAVMDAVPTDVSLAKGKIGIVGEFYILLVQELNHDIEKFLNDLGFILERSTYATGWIAPSMSQEFVEEYHKDAKRIAHKYLSRKIGGDAEHTILCTVDYALKGFDGVIHLMPFTCMPETVAKFILEQGVSEDLDIPVIFFSIDKHSADGGRVTRLEAFTDMIERKRRTRKGVST